MKVPSDAQARVLTFVQAEEAEGRTIYWRAPREVPEDASPSARWLAASEAHPSLASIAFESIDREANSSRFIPYYDGRVRHRSLVVCVREGWISTVHERVFVSGARGFVDDLDDDSDRDRTTILRQLDLTEDGELALGLWHERKANTPVVAPELGQVDRAVLELAQRALALGYRLVPRDEDAMRQARRMKHEGWVQRGWIGRSAMSVLPTATALVELHPERADLPDG